jgi:hypothetical protein
VYTTKFSSLEKKLLQCIINIKYVQLYVHAHAVDLHCSRQSSNGLSAVSARIVGRRLSKKHRERAGGTASRREQPQVSYCAQPSPLFGVAQKPPPALISVLYMVPP